MAVLVLLSSPMLPHVLLAFLLVAAAPTPAASQGYPFCRSTDATFSPNSTFESNLNRLLPSLIANGPATGFFNGTAGDGQDRLYGLVLCRGDVAGARCRTCLDMAAQDIRRSCAMKISAVIWYDQCMLRYSYLAFFSVPDDTLKIYLRNENDLPEVTQFTGQLKRLLPALVRYAAYNSSGQLFATGEAGYLEPTPTIYGLVQCTRDQSPDDCNACLTGIVGEIPSLFHQSIGFRILKATCNFRIELYPFYNGAAMVSIPLAPPPATEGGEKSSTVTVLAIVIPVGAAMVLISIICFCFCRRRSGKEKQQKYMAVSDDVVTVESSLFDLPTLKASIGNFSDLNKLGQG